MPTILFGIDRKTKKEVHIEIASKINKYVCPVCKQPLIIRDGNEKEKHFAHFKPKEECILRTKNVYLDQFRTGSVANGIKQDFADWMEYVRAVERGDYEKAATLWDFDLTSEGAETAAASSEASPPSEDKEPDVSMTFPQMATEQHVTSIQPLVPASEQTTVPKNEYKRVAPIGDDLEYITGQAMIKLIKNGMITYCPLDYSPVPAEQCERCKHCLDIRQPLVNPDSPHAVLCKGHHIK